MKKGILILLMFVVSTQALSAEESYTQNLKRDLSRGLINIVSSPLEIPITMQKYHEQAGYPGVRHIEGFFDGTFRMLERAGSGIWDWIVAWIPGDQDGIPPEPEIIA